MTVEIGIQILGGLGIILGAVMGYGRMKNKVEDQYEENKNLWTEIGKLRTVVETHEKESNEVRREIDREMSRIREAAGKDGGKLDLILTAVTDLKRQVEELQAKVHG